MAWRFALVIDPAASDDPRTSFSATFTPADPTAPVLSAGDRSAQRGDGIFETISVIDGHAQEIDAHLERLAHSAALCDLPAPHLTQWRQAIETAADAAEPGESAVKLILSRGVERGASPTGWVLLRPAADNSRVRTEGVRVATLDRGYRVEAAQRAPWLLLGAKTLSYGTNMAAIREARRRGADDAMLVSSDGFLLEGPTSSVVLRLGDTFVTPEPGRSILRGTTQLSVFSYLEGQGYPTEYRLIPAEALQRADAAWLVSSVRLAAPISAVDGSDLPVDLELTASINGYLLSHRD